MTNLTLYPIIHCDAGMATSLTQRLHFHRSGIGDILDVLVHFPVHASVPTGVILATTSVLEATLIRSLVKQHPEIFDDLPSGWSWIPLGSISLPAVNVNFVFRWTLI